MRVTKPLLFTFAFLASVIASGQITIIGGVQPQRTRLAVVTNSDVVRMVNAHVAEPNIIQTIRNSRCSFDISPDALMDLKSRGVSDAVVSAMLDRSSKGIAVADKPVVAAALKQQSEEPQHPAEAGLYYRSKDGHWLPVAFEEVHFNTGRGFMSTFVSGLTEGIKKAKYTASVDGAASKCRVSVPVDLLFLRPDATAVEDFHLIPVTSKSAAREFQVGEARGGLGGIASGKAMPKIGNPDAIPFHCEQVSAKACILKADLKKGEFALVGPIARVYTFGIE